MNTQSAFVPRPSLVCQVGIVAFGGQCGRGPLDSSSALTLRPNRGERLGWKESKNMAPLDWSQCPAVESIPGKVSGAWVFKNTRMPVATVFENLEAGLTVEEVMEEFSVTREQINAVLDFAAKSLVTPLPSPVQAAPVDAHSL
jgi:uncharacterized protein (DUF433 family)